jgi:hypothetical protein
MAYKTRFKDGTVTVYVPEGTPAAGGDTLAPDAAASPTPKPDSSKK